MSDFPQTIYGNESEPYQTFATAPRWDIGTKLETADGRVFRGTLNGGTGLESQVLCQSKIDATMDALALQTKASVDDRSIKLTNATTFLSLNEAKGGYVAIWLDADPATEAQVFRIWSNNVTVTSGGTTTATLVLWPGLKVLEAVPIASGLGSIVINPFSQVIVCPAGATALPVGVTTVNITADYYGWLQTRGIIAVKADDSDTGTIGDRITVGTTDAGSIKDGDQTVTTLVGFSLQATVGDDNSFVVLGLE